MSGLRTQRQDLRPFERAFPLSKYGKVGSKSTFQRWRPLAPGRKQSARQLRSTEHRSSASPFCEKVSALCKMRRMGDASCTNRYVDSERGGTRTWQMHAWRCRDSHHPRLYPWTIPYLSLHASWASHCATSLRCCASSLDACLSAWLGCILGRSECARQLSAQQSNHSRR